MLEEKKNVMVYAGASGVGTAALQIINYYGATSFFTCSNNEKIEFCKRLLHIKITI
jgi:tumor protein p53-inducible protein 3